MSILKEALERAEAEEPTEVAIRRLRDIQQRAISAYNDKIAESNRQVVLQCRDLKAAYDARKDTLNEQRENLIAALKGLEDEIAAERLEHDALIEAITNNSLKEVRNYERMIRSSQASLAALEETPPRASKAEPSTLEK